MNSSAQKFTPNTYPKIIDSFFGEYRFLSNFYPCNLQYEGIIYPSIEHAYVAAKTSSMEEKKEISLIPTPGEAKRYGRKYIDPKEAWGKDWDIAKLGIMRNLIDSKFSNKELGNKLIETGKAILIEGNTWGDKFWGQCPVGEGQNQLGKLLMAKRNKLKMRKIHK